MENEWQIDPKTGERYRMVGHIREYEMLVRVDGIEIPQSQLADYHKRKKVAEEERRRKALEEAKNRPEPKGCPWNTGMNNQCKREKCALFLDGGCSIAILADAHGTDHPIVKGAKCPFSVYARCDGCALNNGGGCAIVRLAAVNK